MSLYAGAGREITTPAVGAYLFGYNDHTVSESVHDDLTVTVLVLRGKTPGGADISAVLLSVSVCLIHAKLVEEIAEKVSAVTGVPAEHVVVSCTHTHSAPRTTFYPLDAHFGKLDSDYFFNLLLPKCVSAAQQAAANMHPVKMAVGTTESKVGINRRQLWPDGRVTLGQNPWDPHDPTMTVITFRTCGETGAASGKTIANIVHYGAHPTATGNTTEITRDWVGVMTDRLDEESGGLTLFVNGTQGDVAPRMANGGSTGEHINHAMEVGGVAGIDAARAWRSARAFYHEPLEIVRGDLELPLQPNDTPLPKDPFWRAKQVLVRLGPVVLVPFPFEVSTEIGMRLRAYSPFAHTLLLACTNGSNSYLPAQSQLARGGYEVNQFYKHRTHRLPDDTDTQLINQNLELIKHLIP
jgi:hypothetical protein